MVKKLAVKAKEKLVFARVRRLGSKAKTLKNVENKFKRILKEMFMPLEKDFFPMPLSSR